MGRATTARGPSSVGTHIAVTTTVVLVVVLSAVFAELTANEHDRSIAARRSASEMVTALFAESASAAVVFDDRDALENEVRQAERTPGVLGAALFRASSTEPVASSSTSLECLNLSEGVFVTRDRIIVARRIKGRDAEPVGTACVVFSLEQENRAFRQTRLRMAVRGLLTVVAIAALLILLSRRMIVRPLMHLVDAASSIARGERGARAEVPSNDEIGQLALAFNRMGDAVANREQRLRTELEMAAHLQVSILPKSPRVPGAEIAARMDTATEVGGDYYDVIPVPDGCWLGIGDVSGHGLGSGVIMLMIQSAVGALVRTNPLASPREVDCIVNQLVYENVRVRMGRRDHATLTMLKYDPSGRVRFAGAHEDILVFRASTGKVEQVETPGTWVGAVRSIERVTEESSMHLGIGDVMVLYTDGLTEAFREGEQFGIDRLAANLQVNAAAGRTVEEIRDALIGAARAWCGDRVSDDMSIVVLRHVGLTANWLNQLNNAS